MGAEGENRAVEEVKQRHLSVNFPLSLSSSRKRSERSKVNRRREIWNRGGRTSNSRKYHSELGLVKAEIEIRVTKE